ncbi:F-box/kelch-repeat protein [Pyrus ussuriensis x Pyrus communis]|uniref:F-box/kelch-repeat protein n=1 Tax=Pyrus ussuriensis x Pyrus communis TaxID=2448454 RepID=A0A5N5G8S9_9ROSA|nr:F-box/kelch-repeat protein [Pyrus ussuriensis x Pyrus communis]
MSQVHESETPEDKVVEILSRLPSKSLMRFKCIRKSWCTLINGPSFVAKHLNNSVDNKRSSNTCILLNRSQMPVFPDNSWKYEVFWSMISLSIDSDEHNLHYDVEDLNIPFPMEDHHPVVIHGKNVVLCNPAIGEFRQLPDCLLLPLPNIKFQLETSFGGLGFGYDCKAKEYKVVRITENCEYSDAERTYYHRIDLPHTAQVYTTTANSWKEIKIDISKSSLQFCNLFLYNESLACFCSLYGPSGNSRLFEIFEIWVMDDYHGVKSSWTKLLAIGPFKHNENPLTFWKSDEFLMVTSDRRVTSYNSSTGNLKYLLIPPIMNEVIDLQALIYVESIVPVN